MGNIYFDLTEAFNARQVTVALASGQAVVYYRVAIMSKDGDWIVRETPDACEQVLAELEKRGATYRPSAPLDVRWLSGGWSSHFEFMDERVRRVRCDFISRPPRIDPAAVDSLFARADPANRLLAVDVESLILMKRTQRAKDYAVIGELATLLPAAREIDLTTDPDRILQLAPLYGRESSRSAVRAALSGGGGRRGVVLALAAEADDLQAQDRRRMDRYEAAAREYLEACRRSNVARMPLREAHERLLEVASRLLPVHLPPGDRHADAQ